MIPSQSVFANNCFATLKVKYSFKHLSVPIHALILQYEAFMLNLIVSVCTFNLKQTVANRNVNNVCKLLSEV